MGRPLTDRWIGADPGPDPVLFPLIRLGQHVTRGFILRQVGADKCLVRCSETGEVGICRFANMSDLPKSGLMCLRFAGYAQGFVSRISNHRLRDFHGNQFNWSIHGPSEGVVHVIDSISANK